MSSARREHSRFPKTSEIRRVLTPATPWATRDLLPKAERVNVRVSREEKREMLKTAEIFGMELSAYLLRLHRLTVAIGAEQGERATRLPRRRVN